MIKLVFSFVAVVVSGCWTVPVASPVPSKIVLRRGQTVTKTIEVEYRNPRRNVVIFDTEQ